MICLQTDGLTGALSPYHSWKKILFSRIKESCVTHDSIFNDILLNQNVTIIIQSFHKENQLKSLLSNQVHWIVLMQSTLQDKTNSFRVKLIQTCLPLHYGEANFSWAPQSFVTTETKLNRLHFGPDGPYDWFFICNFWRWIVFIP